MVSFCSCSRTRPGRGPLLLDEHHPVRQPYNLRFCRVSNDLKSNGICPTGAKTEHFREGVSTTSYTFGRTTQVSVGEPSFPDAQTQHDP